MADPEPDRLSIPSSRMSDEDERRRRRYTEEARSQDLSDADDASRDREVSGRARRRARQVPGDRPE